MAKRSIISQLPVIHQTKTLQKFFNATVDQVFQPGETTQVNAFVGKKPSYYNPEKDFYKVEVSKEREFYQLEPAMTTRGIDGNFSDLLFYPDLINHLRFQGANVSDVNRLLETDSYSWCPPINVDKLANYRDYYWLPYGPPVLVIDATVEPYHIREVSDGVTTSYRFPPTIPGATMDVIVNVDGIPLDFGTHYTFSGGFIILTSAVTTGKVIDITFSGNYKQNIEGKPSYSHPLPVSGYVTTYLETAQGIETTRRNSGAIERPVPLLPTMLVEISDIQGTNVYEVAHDQDGNIKLVAPLKTTPSLFPAYRTIERTASNRNKWSRTNNWYHRDTMFLQDWEFAPIKATRPIIEFSGDLELMNHGINGLPDVNLIWDDVTGDPHTILNTDPTAPNRLINPSYVNDLTKSQCVDFRVLSKLSSDPSLDDNIFGGEMWVEVMDYDVAEWDEPKTVICGEHGPHNIQAFWELGLTTVSIQKKEDAYVPSTYDFVKLHSNEDYLHFDGKDWKDSQWVAGGTPLFQLYDTKGIKLTNPADHEAATPYSGTDYKGSEIFAYKAGDWYDADLGINTSKNKWGNFEFEDRITLDVINYAGGSYSGMKFYAERTKDGVTLKSNWLPIKGSTASTTDGFADIPLNLQANPLNDNVTTVSVNDWNKHFKPVLEGNNWLASSRYFDLSFGRNILQHRSPLLKTMLLSTNSSLDVQKAILYSEREYLRFKNKFAQSLLTMTHSQDISDATQALTQILESLKTAKTPDFPFSNNAIIGDYFIPATGAYLGISPLWKPELIIDATMVQIRGHDGSLTKGTAEVVDGAITPSNRDLVTLALEEAIYASADAKLRSDRRPLLDYLALTSGKFRSGEYTRDEVTLLAKPMFEQWSARSSHNPTQNTLFSADDPFTWNYRGLVDVDGQELPGYWRGIYKYFFDTDRPHSHPWEMLGYTTKPVFWDDHYSWTQAAKRTALIDAIVNGVVNPLTQERDAAFARPNFAKFCPVDPLNNLLNPVEANIVDINASALDYKKLSGVWQFGDNAPVENLWWNSVSVSYTLAHLTYLMKPVRFVESNWITADEIKSHDQWHSVTTGSRVHDVNAIMHNEVGFRNIGLQTWISDYIRSQGQDITLVLGEKVRSLNVNVSHKLGGFVDPASVKTFTENSGLIPQESVNLALYRSPSIREEFYGGVIIEWAGNGWRVLGYDITDSVFKIHPTVPTGKKVKLTVGEEPNNAVEWRIDTYYQASVLVHHNGTNYRSIKTHTSSRDFEQEFWVAESMGSFSPASSVLWHLEHDDDIERIPYGTLLSNRQEVSDFLSGYQAYLKGRGWVFDEYDEVKNRINDFATSALEFLQWSQVEWSEGVFLAVSPAATSLKFTSTYGTVQNVEQLVNGVYSLVDRQGNAIPRSTVTVNRLDDEITIGVTSGGIYGSRVFVSEVEQAIVFNNKTLFNDVIYEPLYNLRQSRIRLIALISKGWQGRLDAPGFVITDNRLVPSFERQVEDIRHMYDIEKTINLPLRENARHQIGYQGRDYLENLMYNDTNQFEFYQGMIKHKGAPGVFKRLMRNEGLTVTRNLSFLEEWAFRKGSYGGLETRNVFEFLLSRDSVVREQQLIEQESGSLWDYMRYDIDLYDYHTSSQLTEMDKLTDTVVKLYNNDNQMDSRWIIPPVGDMFESVEDFTRQKGSLPTAGYARLSDTQYQALTLAGLNDYMATLSVDLVLGNRVQIYKDHKNSWDIYRVVDYNARASDDSDPFVNSIHSFVPSLDGTTVSFEGKTNFKVNDVVYFEKGMQIDSEQLVGPHVITWVSEDAESIRIATDVLEEKYYDPSEEQARVFKLESVRFRHDNAILEESNLFHTVINAQAISINKAKSLGATAEYTDGELIYVDVCWEFAHQTKVAPTQRRWVVFAKDGDKFRRVRQQPVKIRRDRIIDVRIFENRSVRSNSTLNAKPLRYGDIVTYDPAQGMIAGVADTEIEFKLAHDPAFYNNGKTRAIGLAWGQEQVGKLWWNIDTVRFINSETNSLVDDEEKAYRINNWGRIAPNTSVDVYEWTRSTLSPADWQEKFEKGEDAQYDGAVLNPEDPSWVEGQVWDSKLGQHVDVYYFWVKGRANTPTNNPARKLSAQEVQQCITNPLASGVAWLAPITERGMILTGVSQFLSSESSIQFTVKKSNLDVPRHVEWDLVREGDERSRPSQELWDKIVTSLIGKDVWGNALPSKDRYVNDRVGYDVEHGQTIFKDIREARKNTVDKINQILSRTAAVDYRSKLSEITFEDGTDPTLYWEMNTESSYIPPMPGKTLWNDKSVSVDNVENNTLFYSLKAGEKYWSVMSRGADKLLNVIKLYDYQVETVAELKAMEVSSIVEIGQRVQLKPQNGLWTIWEKQATGLFIIVDVQKVRSDDAWLFSDWYEPGYENKDAPIYTYDTNVKRNKAVISNPHITFTKILDDGKGKWLWTELRNGSWVTVAKQDGTIKLSDVIWQNYRLTSTTPVGTTLTAFDQEAVDQYAATRDLGNELNYILSAMKDHILTGLELNELFFNWINYAHTEQDFIDWCFKTSFMYVTGYNDRLRQDPLAFVDLTDNLLSYINEVKPYHVKVRDFISKYGIELEKVTVSVCDFDKPAYYDVALGVNRILDETNAKDLEIIRKGVWKHWYSQTLLGEESKARKMKLSHSYLEDAKLNLKETIDIVVFRKDGVADDIDYGWDIISYDGDTEYDFEEEISTVDYQKRYLSLEQYGLSNMDLFEWDELTGNPRRIAVRVNDVAPIDDHIILDVNTNRASEAEPMLNLHIEIDGKGNYWNVASPATQLNYPI